MSLPEESFLTHLFELRDRLIRALLAVGIVFICLFPWSKELYTMLAQPLLDKLPKGGQMIATDVVGVFLVPMKVTMMAAFLIALPYVLYQAWAFIAPGLYKHEKRLALPLVAASVLLFFSGMAFAYFLVFPTVFGFMASIAPEGVAWMTDIDKYLSFVLSTFVAFGVTFEVPVVVIVLVHMGMVTIAQLKEWRPYVIVGAFVIGAIFTPPDVVSQIMLALPLCLLYELGILLSRFVTPVPADLSTVTEVEPYRYEVPVPSPSPAPDPVPASDWSPVSGEPVTPAVAEPDPPKHSDKPV